MPYTKRIVCLANSFRQGGTCIAGREVLADGYGGWIRPVSARATAELWLSECLYGNYELPKVLDVMDVPLREPAFHAHHTENHIVDAAREWIKVRELPPSELPRLEERPEALGIDKDSTSAGLLNCVAAAESVALHGSLMLIRARGAAVEVVAPKRGTGASRAYWVDFAYQTRKYRLKLTDPVAIGPLEKRPAGVVPLGDVYLCLSLTLPFSADGRCHKLVAAILPNPL